jgi:ATP synthase in type III secretion protein N
MNVKIAQIGGPLGKVVRLIGPVVTVAGLDTPVGGFVRFYCATAKSQYGEVIGLERSATGSPLLSVMPLGDSEGFRHGTFAVGIERFSNVSVSIDVGCVVDGIGYQLDIENGLRRVDETQLPPAMFLRSDISTHNRVTQALPLVTGVKAMDVCLPLATGQRVALLAPAGVGKSTVLSMILSGTSADKIVLCLIGERGREAAEMVEYLASTGHLEKSVVVIATSERPAAERAKAPLLALQVAEELAQQGNQVLVLLDSLTRYCRALREIGLAAGEQPTRRGYPASVFSSLPRILERAGNFELGSITMVASVLVEDDLMPDPIAEEVQSLSDGHIWLSREMATQGKFPAIDILKSVSRMAHLVQSDDSAQLATTIRKCLAAAAQNDTLIRMGEYKWGVDNETDQLIESASKIKNTLLQHRTEYCDPTEAIEQLIEATQ